MTLCLWKIWLERSWETLQTTPGQCHWLLASSGRSQACFLLPANKHCQAAKGCCLGNLQHLPAHTTSCEGVGVISPKNKLYEEMEQYCFLSVDTVRLHDMFPFKHEADWAFCSSLHQATFKCLCRARAGTAASVSCPVSHNEEEQSFDVFHTAFVYMLTVSGVMVCVEPSRSMLKNK